MVFSEDQLS